MDWWTPDDWPIEKGTERSRILACPRDYLSGVDPIVHQQRRPRDAPRALSGEEDHRVGDVVRRGKASHGAEKVRRPDDALPALMRLARPAGAPDRTALVVSSDYPEAVELVTRFYDRLGFDTVDNSPLRESWRSVPGTPMWAASFDGQTRGQLIRNLERAERVRA